MADNKLFCLGTCGKPLDMTCSEFFAVHEPFSYCPTDAIRREGGHGSCHKEVEDVTHPQPFRE